MATKEKPQCIQEFEIKVYKVTVVGTSNFTYIIQYFHVQYIKVPLYEPKVHPVHNVVISKSLNKVRTR